MKKLFILCGLLVLGLGRVSALELRPDHPDHYVVVKGDTLWDISGKFLTNPWEWPRIWNQNPQVENPHLIYPGDVLVLRFVNGEPVLMRAEDRRVPVGERIVKLVPEVRVTGHDGAVPPIPLDAIQPFLSRPLVFERNNSDSLPYIVANEGQRLVSGAGKRVYIRGLEDETTARFSIYRPGPAIVDRTSSEDGEVLGYVALHVGDLRLDRLGDTATGTITRSKIEVNPGDRVLPLDDVKFPEFIPHAPEELDFEGRILSVLDDSSQIGAYMIVTLNRGYLDGLQPGHVLSIWQEGEVVDDVFGAKRARARVERTPVRTEYFDDSAFDRLLSQLFTDIRDTKFALDRLVGEDERLPPNRVKLPTERAGELIVFRAFERVSFGLVLKTQLAVHVHDIVRHP